MGRAPFATGGTATTFTGLGRTVTNLTALQVTRGGTADPVRVGLTSFPGTFTGANGYALDDGLSPGNTGIQGILMISHPDAVHQLTHIFVIGTAAAAPPSDLAIIIGTAGEWAANGPRRNVVTAAEPTGFIIDVRTLDALNVAVNRIVNIAQDGATYRVNTTGLDARYRMGTVSPLGVTADGFEAFSVTAANADRVAGASMYGGEATPFTFAINCIFFRYPTTDNDGGTYVQRPGFAGATLVGPRPDDQVFFLVDTDNPFLVLAVVSWAQPVT
jgi:hypothetical protein